MLLYILLFLAGLFEEAVAILYYGFIRKNWKLPCAILSMVRNLIWIFAGAGILSSFFGDSSLPQQIFISILRATVHTIGVGVGNYLSLILEPYIHLKILKLKNNGRKKKRWYLIERK